MKHLLKTVITAAAFAGAAALAGTPAQAQGFSIGVGPGGVNFSLDSGGYCDRDGCPDSFWDMPVYYCPVYWHGEWYRGPLYYRRAHGHVWYWIHGDWQRDQWDRPRPAWACTDRFGPALGFQYYEDHGFHMRPEWEDRWHRDHPDQWQHWHDRRGGMDRHDNMMGGDHHDNMMGGDHYDHHDNMMGGDHHDNMMGGDHHDHHDNMMGGDHHDNMMGGDHHDNMMGGDHHDHHDNTMGGDHHDHHDNSGGGSHGSNGNSGSSSSGSNGDDHHHHHDDNGQH